MKSIDISLITNVNTTDGISAAKSATKKLKNLVLKFGAFSRKYEYIILKL